MDLENRIRLWNELHEFPLDDPQARVRFSDRLSSEQGWSKEFTARAMEEYRRFLFLSSVTGQRVSPSGAVDQVWHLHLTYTRSYWDGLCKTVLKRRFHHEPGDAPKEDRQFQDQYQQTLDSYVAYIGHEPPPDIWGFRANAQNANAVLS